MKCGKRLTPDGAYARELGIKPKQAARALRIRGGAEKLRSLDPDARAILMGPHIYGNSQTVIDGGMKARGMKTRKRGYLIPPQVPCDEPLEVLLSDEDLPEFEGLGE